MPDLNEAFSLLTESYQWLAAGKAELAEVARKEAERTLERSESHDRKTTIHPT